MHMKHRLGADTQCIQGLVLDHGTRHPDMPKRLENCYVLTCNVSLEYEKSELTAVFQYDDPKQKERMALAERKITDDRVRQIIELKKQVCTKENGKSFVVINQKGIDPISLEMLARAGIMGLRRAKRRNMERMQLLCGGEALNSTDDMTPEVLGYAGLVYEHTLGDEKYTFVEDVKFPKSCTLLIKGPNEHTIAQIKDAVRDGLRAVKNTLDDKCVIPGAGAFEVAASVALAKYAEQAPIEQTMGIEAFTQSLLVIPKALAANSGFDVQETCRTLTRQHATQSNAVGVDVETGGVLNPLTEGILDNYVVKRGLLESCGVIASELLLVDEIIKAGKRGPMV